MRKRDKFLQYISEKSPRYKREMKKKMQSSYGRAFGERSLSEYNNQREVKNIDDESGKVFKIEKAYLKMYLTEEYKEAHESALKFFEEVLRDLEINEYFQKLLQIQKQDLLVEAVANYFVEQGVDDNIFARMIELHVSNFKEKQEAFEIKTKKWISEFRNEVVDAVEIGYLNIDMDIVEKRIETIVSILKDPLENTTLGQHDDWAEIFINDSLPEEKRRLAFFHELTHKTLSGRIVKEVEVKGIKDFNFLEHQKIGLAIREERNGQIRRRLGWLNEAVTEDIALSLSKEKDQGHYLMERSSMKNMGFHGVPEQAFRDAYTENYEPGQKGLPKWFELMNELRKAEGQGTIKKRNQDYRTSMPY